MYKKRLYILIITFFFLFNFVDVSKCSTSENSKTKILIIGSYSIENDWEKSIMSSFIDYSQKDFSIKTEFIDSKSAKGDKYYDSLINLYDLKYSNEEIDYILAVDDEALDFVRKNIFDERYFLFEKTTIFVGINSNINLSEKEKKYFTGIIDYQDNLDSINTILKTNSNISDLYLILDNTIFCNTIKNNICDIKEYCVRDFNIHNIQCNRFDEILLALNNINKSKSAIFLCGNFYDDSSKLFLSSKDTISKIKELTSAPIYTKVAPYVYGGAIGGIVNDGEKLGIAAARYINKIRESNNYHLFNPGYSSLNTPLFNYKALMEYNINPLILPRNSQYINRGFFDLLVPKYIKYCIWLFCALLIIIMIYIIVLLIKNRHKMIKKNQLIKESIERENIRTDFIITISHELRTPLNIIMNSSKLLSIKNDTNLLTKSYVDQQLEFINKNTNRLLRLINNLIDVSKIQSGYMDTNFTMENIVNIIEEVTLSVVSLAKSNNINIIFDTDFEEIITAIDKNKIERVMLNLLSNSIKFGRDDGYIYVRVKKQNDLIYIIVEDNGLGISEDLQKNLFQKFKRGFSSSISREKEGSGLGLYIVKGLIDLHKGNIQVSSELGIGTRIEITLPIIIVDECNENSEYYYSHISKLTNIELADINKTKL